MVASPQTPIARCARKFSSVLSAPRPRKYQRSVHHASRIKARSSVSNCNIQFNPPQRKMTRFKRQASSIQHPASSIQRPALKTIAAILPDWTIFHGAIFKVYCKLNSCWESFDPTPSLYPPPLLLSRSRESLAPSLCPLQTGASVHPNLNQHLCMHKKSSRGKKIHGKNQKN